MKFTAFGSDPWSWNTGWSRSAIGAEIDDNSGNPGIGMVSNALSVWSALQDRSVTVDEAATVFNLGPALIRQAIDYHNFMFVGPGDVIEHDGE